MPHSPPRAGPDIVVALSPRNHVVILAMRASAAHAPMSEEPSEIYQRIRENGKYGDIRQH